MLIVLNAFLGLTAVGGGVTLLIGTFAPPLEMLEGSFFSSYLIPGLSLMAIVGGSALAAAVLLARAHPVSAFVSGFAGAAVVGFEVVEVMAIGSPPGPSRNLQVFYFVLGLTIGLLSVAFRLAGRRRGAGEKLQRLFRLSLRQTY